MTARAARAARPVAALAAALVLAGCGGGTGTSTPSAGGGGSAPTSTGGGQTGSASPSVVDGVKLTAQGTQLPLGQTARVSWNPAPNTVGVAAITVTKLQKMPISVFSDWRLSKSTLRSTPYFVHATVRNLGHSDLSGTTVPLYLQDPSGTLLQPSTFQAKFPRCSSQPLPAKFKHGKQASVCLVYFVTHHGKLAAITFRPSGTFRAITWTGHVGNGG